MTDTMETPATETPRQEIRRLKWIMRHVQKLSPAGRAWLLARLRDVECAPTIGRAGERSTTVALGIDDDSVGLDSLLPHPPRR